jgi:2-succinyl-5-enolpyruvyl-6-hydroxy-3-cyclohexene-1-carboxylate synthase
VALIADITANLHQEGLQLPHSDMILGSKAAETLEKLKPDLVVSFGGPVVSKYLKLFLRKYRPPAQWHIQADGQAVDTFQLLTQVIPVHAEYFIETLLTRQAYLASSESPAGTYQHFWADLEAQAAQRLPAFLGDTPFNEFSAVSAVLQALPADSYLQLGNSMSIRYASFIGLGADIAATGIKVNANRGTSGIDGSLSTTVGAALATEKITTLITGDLAFFYDRNALWQQHLPPNLRVVILNNRGGGIFKLIEGPGNLPPAELEQYFFTPQPLTAKNTAADHDCRYFYCANAQDLAQQLPEFFAPNPKPAILEIETDNEVNTQVFQQFKANVAQLAIKVAK